MGGSMSAGACGDCVHCRLREGSSAMAAPCEVLRELGMRSVYVEVDAKFSMNGKDCPWWLEAATRREPWSDGERRQLIIMMREVARRLKHGVGDCVMEICQITREHAGDESPWQ